MNKLNQEGLSLIEVMIALAVFSFGLLALAALMASGLKYNTSALHRSYATSQAYDMADRIRANGLGLDLEYYKGFVLLSAAPSDGSTELNCIVPEFNIHNEVNCSPEEMAYDDVLDWNNTNARLLPEGTGKVLLKSNDPESADFGIYTITVSWDDDRDPATAADSFVFEFKP